MPKFDTGKKPKTDNLDLGFEDEDEEVGGFDDEPTSQSSTNPKSVRLEPKKSDNKSKTIIIICVSVSIAVCLLVVFLLHKSSVDEKNQESVSRQQKAALEAQQKSNSDEESKVKAGAPNLYGDSKDTNTSTVVSENKITTNLNGEKVDPNYKIREIKTVKDFINYTKYRAVTDKGMEFYWLEAMYKEKKYKVQVPFAIYKELEKKGITVVDAEVTVLEDGSEIVTYMNVRKDAKSLLDKDDSN